MTAQIPAAIGPFWNAFRATLAFEPTPRFRESFYFADTEPVANELAALVLAGRKRATAGLLWSYEAEGEPLPQPGELSVVTDWNGAPLGVIETTAVDIVAFEDVSAEFAATEGEGDASLRYWREVHWDFFGRECQAIGRSPERRMPVVCERFALVYPPARGG